MLKISILMAIMIAMACGTDHDTYVISSNSNQTPTSKPEEVKPESKEQSQSQSKTKSELIVASTDKKKDFVKYTVASGALVALGCVAMVQNCRKFLSNTKKAAKNGDALVPAGKAANSFADTVEIIGDNAKVYLQLGLKGTEFGDVDSFKAKSVEDVVEMMEQASNFRLVHTLNPLEGLTTSKIGSEMKHIVTIELEVPIETSNNFKKFLASTSEKRKDQIYKVKYVIKRDILGSAKVLGFKVNGKVNEVIKALSNFQRV